MALGFLIWVTKQMMEPITERGLGTATGLGEK